MLEIAVLGAVESVGKSCVMISDKDRRVVLDAGIQLHPRRSGKLSTPPDSRIMFAVIRAKADMLGKHSTNVYPFKSRSETSRISNPFEVIIFYFLFVN